MHCKGVQRGGASGRRSIPCYVLRLCKQGERSSRQGRHVQRLANVAGSIRPNGVLVDKGAARGEIQQGSAA